MIRDLNYCPKNKRICLNSRCKLSEKSNFQFDDEKDFPSQYLEITASDASINSIDKIIICCLTPEY